MPIVNAFSQAVVREFSLEELEQAARLMRGYDLVALCAAGSGHTGGTLSMMEIVAALYLKVANHDPNLPEWEDRDRIVWSGGHKAPALYLGLGMAGYYPLEDVVTLRKLYSPFQGHPHRLKLPGVEVSTGSLGQGLSIAVGMAQAGKIDCRKHTVFCIMGDGEQQEGSIWEAVMEGSHYKLDNLVGIIDRNRLQIDGWVKDVMNVEPLEVRYRSFGWEVIECDGHDIKQVVEALEKAKKAPLAGKPTVVICNTVKGKGVSFMENVAGWHGKAPSYDEMVKGLEELGLKNNIAYDALLEKAAEYQRQVEAKLDAKMPHFSRDYWWNAEGTPKVEMEPTRKGFGKSLANNGDDERIVCLGLDISGSITISDFYTDKPERKNRWLSMGIAEQSATAAAAGLARDGRIPVLGTYGTFAAARNLDQIRVSVCYGKLQRADCWGARRRVGWSGWRDAPGAGRSICDVRPAEHGGERSVRCHRDAQDDRLPPAEAHGAEIHSVCARGHADRHQGRHAVCVRQGERHPAAAQSRKDGRCLRHLARERLQERT
jgi:transketolase